MLTVINCVDALLFCRTQYMCLNRATKKDGVVMVTVRSQIVTTWHPSVISLRYVVPPHQ